MKTVVKSENVKMMGRCIVDENVCYLGHAGSYVSFEFEGSYVRLTLDTCLDQNLPEYQVYLSIFINNEPKPVLRFSPASGMHTYTVYHSDRVEKTAITIMKITESGYGNVGICMIETDSDAISPVASHNRRIEFIGDSITCGYGAEQQELETFSTSGENCYGAYAIQTARQLKADYHLVAQSGIGVYSGYVEPGTESPSTVDQMPDLYLYFDLSTSRLRGFEPETWSSERWPPDLIVVNLGTNDSFYFSGKEDQIDSFTDAYERFLRFLFQRNPGVVIACTIGMMPCGLCDAVKGTVTKIKDLYPNLHYIPMDQPPGEKGQSGHPSLRMHLQIAEKLSKELRAIMKWD